MNIPPSQAHNPAALPMSPALPASREENLPTYLQEVVLHTPQKPLSDYRIADQQPIQSITLRQGTVVVPDYRTDEHFLDHLISMGAEGAKKLSSQIRKYPDEFPMPCMAITAGLIESDLDKVRNQYVLMPGEDKVLLNVKKELQALSPGYPYQDSLILTLKYLHFRSLLYFRERLLISETLIDYKLDHPIPRREVTNFLKSIGLNLVALYRKDCTLVDLQGLSWPLAVKDARAFMEQLHEKHFSLMLESRAHLTLGDNLPIIPYPWALGIEDLNRIWPLPVWLAGFSLSEFTVADGFDMYPAAFFEHDLFHLRMKDVKAITTENTYEMLFHWIAQLYNHRQLIKSVDFKSIELAVFYIFHEEALFNSIFYSPDENFFKTVYKKAIEVDFKNLPKGYQQITQLDVQQACEWLSRLPIREFTDKEFADRIADIEETFTPNPELKSSKDLNQGITTPPYMHEVTLEVTRHKKVLAEYGLNYDIIISSLVEFRKNAPSEELEKEIPNRKSWLKYAPAFPKEYDWVVHFLKNSHLHGASRCRAASEDY